MSDTDAILTSILALHARRKGHWMTDRMVYGQTAWPDKCDHCGTTWPCATVALIEAR